MSTAFVRRRYRAVLVVLVALVLIVGPAPGAPAARTVDVSLESGCVSRTATNVRADLTLDTPNPGRSTWALRGAGTDRTGAVTWSREDEESYASLVFTLGPGRYRLTITPLDRGHVAADEVFDVLRCVTAKATCRAVTFRNPIGNRSVRVTYWGDDHLVDRTKRNTLTLAAGRSTTVRTYSPVFQWTASGPGGDPAGDGTEGGGSELDVDQHCGPTRTRGVVGCVTGRRGLLRAWFHPPDGRRLRYRVEDFYEKVGAGRVARDRHLSLRLKPGASYAFYSFTAAAEQPYDRVDLFEVVPCVIARARPGAVRFRNPTGGTVRIAYGPAGTSERTVIRLTDGQATTVRVASGTVRWHTNALRPASRWRTDRGRGALRIQG